MIGTSLLHSGVVINGKEYAYGGHDRPGITGVYWTKPRSEPPGGTFRCEILHGFSLAPQNEIDAMIRTASDTFQGTDYNVFSKNCNTFTNHLVTLLTGRPCPGFLNRAASIGAALPCVVPRDWIEPPDYDNADGELLDEEAGERVRMLREGPERIHLVGVDSEDVGWHSDEEPRGGGGKGKGKAPIRGAG